MNSIRGCEPVGSATSVQLRPHEVLLPAKSAARSRRTTRSDYESRRASNAAPSSVPGARAITATAAITNGRSIRASTAVRCVTDAASAVTSAPDAYDAAALRTTGVAVAPSMRSRDMRESDDRNIPERTTRTCWNTSPSWRTTSVGISGGTSRSTTRTASALTTGLRTWSCGSRHNRRGNVRLTFWPGHARSSTSTVTRPCSDTCQCDFIPLLEAGE